MAGIDTGQREYRIRGWQKWLFLFFGLLLTGMGVLVCVIAAQPGGEASLVLACVLPFLIGAYLFALVFRSRLVIGDQRIVVRSLFGERSAEISEVEGFRTITSRNASFWRLYLKQGRGSITIQKWFDCKELRAWFQMLTDLDERDRKQVLDEIEQNQELGATPEERLGALANAKKWNIVFTVVAIAAALAFGLGSGLLRNTTGLLLAVIPVQMIYMVHRGPLLYGIFKPKRDPRTDLSIVFITCGLGLLYGNLNNHFVQISTLLEWAALVTILCCAGIFSSARRSTQMWGSLFAMLLLGGLYGWGLAATADTVPDRATPETFATTVVDKHETHGRSTSYHLDLAPWGPEQEQNEVTVSHSAYDNASIGDSVCLELHPGVLHVQWYRVVGCGGAQ